MVRHGLETSRRVTWCITDASYRVIITLLLTFFFQSRIAVATNSPVLSAGGSHTCALTSLSGGGVYCWGYNVQGQLGNGTLSPSSVPVPVSGISEATAVAAGGDHSCAIVEPLGGVKCWGANTFGQLGNNSNSSSAAPVEVVDQFLLPLTSVVEITAGTSHTCARFSTGGVVCWGLNSSGQLGDGSTTDRQVATAVFGFGSDVSQISAGYAHTCLVQTSTSNVWCFGENMYGALGDNNAPNPQSVPVEVFGITTAEAVSSGDRFTCARLSDGVVACWGANNSGNLGNGTTTDSYVPVLVSGAPYNASMIDAGGSGISENFACAVLASGGQAQCWGTSTEGAIGNGATNQETTPVNVTGLTSVVALTSGLAHACAWTGTCSIKCWGANSQGQLGNGDLTNHSVPVDIEAFNCSTTDPTPTPVPPTPTPAPVDTPPDSPGQSTPDACRSEKRCIPDASLTTPLDPRAPQFNPLPMPKGSNVPLAVNPVKIGIPVNETQRQTLKRRLEKLLGKKITDLAAAVRSLQVFYVFTVVRAKTTSIAAVDATALPTKYRAETRKRRVTARLGPGSYVATVSVKIKTSKGKVVASSKKPTSATFVVK